MPEIQGYDYSGGRPGGAALKAAGAAFVVRYLKKSSASGVAVLTQTEYLDLTGHGLGVALVYEAASASRAGQGAVAGATDAFWALGQARDVGIATPRGIYFAVDYDADPDDVTPYFQAIHSRLGEMTGAYASYRVLDHLFTLGLIRWGWQPAAWSHGLLHPKAHLYQRVGGHLIGGVACDQNVALTVDYAQHPAPTSANTVTPNPQIEEVDMLLVGSKNPKTGNTDFGLLTDQGIKHLLSMTTVNGLKKRLGDSVTIDRQDWDAQVMK